MISAFGTARPSSHSRLAVSAGRCARNRLDSIQAGEHANVTDRCESRPRRAFADPAGSPSPFAFQVQRRFGKLARVTSPRSASESKSPSIESAAPGCLRAGRSSATTSPRSVTSMVSPLRTSRRYSDNLDFSCLTPTDFIVLTVATGGYKINRAQI